MGVIPQDSTPGMTRRAQLHQFPGAESGCFHHQIIVFHLGPGHVRQFGPFHMTRSGTVTGLAAHIDVRPGGLIGIGLDIVVFFQIGGMAFGTHAVPVLSGIGPVQPVLRVNRLFG